MSSILYGGLRYTKIRHAVFCKKCKNTIESVSQHDYKLCPCGAVGIDGGILEGNRFIGNQNDMESRCMYKAILNKKEIWLPQNIIVQTLQ
jgi:hypothetical protein